MSWQVSSTYEVKPEEVEKTIADYFRNYHPAGYGTRVESKTPFVNDKGENMVRIKFTRARSCD